jgi:RIO-like serine/threonine protein kinase
MITRDLKHDALGTTRLVERGSTQIVERDTRTARLAVRWLARWLAAREAAALTALAAIDCVPKLLEFDGAIVRRSYVPGAPLYEAPPRSPLYFVNALRLLRALHRAGVAHNDLAKEANWLVSPGDTAGIVDFQLAICSRTRGRWFRRRAYEDLRHLLKHKRTYLPHRLTARQLRVLARPALGARLWRAVAKPAYRFVTRRLLRWSERSGPIERKG